MEACTYKVYSSQPSTCASGTCSIALSHFLTIVPIFVFFLIYIQTRVFTRLDLERAPKSAFGLVAAESSSPRADADGVEQVVLIYSSSWKYSGRVADNLSRCSIILVPALVRIPTQPGKREGNQDSPPEIVAITTRNSLTG